MNRLFLTLCCVLMLAGAKAQVALDSTRRAPGYVQNIVARSGKIVNLLGLSNDDAKRNVLNVIANRYFLLNDLYAKYASDRQALEAELYKHHFEFAAALADYLTDGQIETVKDGMTYGVVPKTYQAHLEMIPSLKEDEKLRILNWLKEAREFAIDASDAKSKHAWFGKYKGRINNWLASRGYDLKAEREAWMKRVNK
ncbi:DUF3826 domain-containing protein [Prevotella buccae]|uniref:DUF3826 domain-containing protein n=1 Tax=Segatella buccae TaxID=28126 RepID=UPI001C5FC47C|nr:DUF3826 domain-containing protein [Segatella buccae]MBW4870630.1 DUF3826 domain-containing protein [Segatella buccae]